MQLNNNLKSFFWAFTGAVLGFFLNYFTQVTPHISKINETTSNIDKRLINIDEKLLKIEDKYLKKDDDGVECRVGYNSEIPLNTVSVFSNNKYDLKRGDRIELTYLFGATKVSIECSVSLVENNSNNSSDADLFVCKECLSILQISKKDYNKGIFYMKFRKIE